MNRLIENNQITYNQTISCKEKNKKLEFKCNSKEFYKVHIDSQNNTILTNNDSRCDYAIVDCDLNSIALFVELKGSDLNKAFNQILCSKNEFDKEFRNLYGAIVHSGKIATTTEQNLKKKAKGKEGLKMLFIKRDQLQLAYNNNIIEKIN